jgi:hypothetical protein
MVMCRCVDPDLYKCLSERFQTGLSMARVMAGCNCRCHQPASGGTAITREEWQKNRERIARPERPSREEVRDPRIKALMQQEEVQS